MKYQQEKGKGMVGMEGSKNNQDYDGRGGGSDSSPQRCPHCSSFDIKLGWSRYFNFFQPRHVCRTRGRTSSAIVRGRHTKLSCFEYFNFSQPRHICKTCGRSWLIGEKQKKALVGDYGYNKKDKRSRRSSSPSPAGSSSSAAGAGTGTDVAPAAGGSSSFAGAGGTGPSAAAGPSGHRNSMITTTTTIHHYNRMEFKIRL